MPPTSPNATRPMTFGEKAVGLTFNPSSDPNVQKVKELYAEIIDLMVNLSVPTTNTGADLLTESIHQAQTAQMWAVKAITWKN